MFGKQLQSYEKTSRKLPRTEIANNENRQAECQTVGRSLKLTEASLRKAVFVNPMIVLIKHITKQWFEANKNEDTEQRMRKTTSDNFCFSFVSFSLFNCIRGLFCLVLPWLLLGYSGVREFSVGAVECSVGFA